MMFIRRRTIVAVRRVALVAIVAQISGCGDESSPPTGPEATTLEVSPEFVALSAPGSHATLEIRILDQFGNPLEPSPDGSLVVSSADTTVVRVHEHAVIGLAPGTTEVTASWQGLEASVSVTVAPYPTDGPWTLLPASPTAEQLHFMDASFISPDEGWVVGIPGAVHYTSDGGLTWQERYTGDPDQSQAFRAAAFVNSNLGWIGDLGVREDDPPVLWETVDGGFTWTAITERIVGPMPVGICGLFVIDESTVVGVGRWNGPAVFVRTDDAGATWQSISLEPLATGAVDVHFFDAENGIIAGGRGTGSDVHGTSRVVILGTSDGGATWEERFVGSTEGRRSWKISFPTPDVGYVATQGPVESAVILKTVDGGQTWTELPVSASGFGGGFWGVGFTTPERGWISRTRTNDPFDVVNDVYETSDGGETWTRVLWMQGMNVNRYRMFPDGSGYAIGKRIFVLDP